MKPTAPREPQISSAWSPPEWADWPDDRVTCEKCSHRSGFRCIPLDCSTHPLDVKHRCEKFSPRIARLPARGA